MNRITVIIITCLICFGYTELRLYPQNKLNVVVYNAINKLLDTNIYHAEKIESLFKNQLTLECDIYDEDNLSKECQEFNKVNH